MASNKWLSSKEVLKIAKIKSCELMHLRKAGKLNFEKRGNAYFYDQSSLENLKD